MLSRAKIEYFDDRKTFAAVLANFDVEKSGIILGTQIYHPFLFPPKKKCTSGSPKPEVVFYR